MLYVSSLRAIVRGKKLGLPAPHLAVPIAGVGTPAHGQVKVRVRPIARPKPSTIHNYTTSRPRVRPRLFPKLFGNK